jgi:hypothetical protein
MRPVAFRAFVVSSNVVGLIAAAVVVAESHGGVSDALVVGGASILLVAVTSGLGLFLTGRRARSEYVKAVRAYHTETDSRAAQIAAERRILEDEEGEARATLALLKMQSDLHRDYLELYRKATILSKEIVPAFQDAGLSRSRDSFLHLVDDLGLEQGEAKQEKAFINQTVDDPDLDDQQKIDRLVRHFAPAARGIETA